MQNKVKTINKCFILSNMFCNVLWYFGALVNTVFTLLKLVLVDVRINQCCLTFNVKFKLVV